MAARSREARPRRGVALHSVIHSFIYSYRSIHAVLIMTSHRVRYAGQRVKGRLQRHSAGSSAIALPVKLTRTTDSRLHGAVPAEARRHALAHAEAVAAAVLLARVLLGARDLAHVVAVGLDAEVVAAGLVGGGGAAVRAVLPAVGVVVAVRAGAGGVGAVRPVVTAGARVGKGGGFVSLQFLVRNSKCAGWKHACYATYPSWQ